MAAVITRLLWVLLTVLFTTTSVRSQYPLCFADDPNGPWSLSALESTFDYPIAVVQCRDHCREGANKHYFGVRRDAIGYSSHWIYEPVRCFCGDTINYDLESDCRLTCGGVGAYPCGDLTLDDGHISVYSACHVGKYGPSCNLDCLQDCFKGECYPDSGLCCPVGKYKYGSGCKDCPNNNCKGSPCDLENGKCPNGCTADQWYGFQCVTQCTAGGRHCTDNKCEQSDGECINSCQVGSYGTYCNQTCPTNCNEACNRASGGCDNGCIGKSHGVFCESTCPVNCIDKACNENDDCTRGCLAGFQGSKCTEDEEYNSETLPTWVYAVIGVMAVAIVSLVVTLVVCFRRGARHSTGDKQTRDSSQIERTASYPDSTWDIQETTNTSLDTSEYDTIESNRRNTAPKTHYANI